ncbi:MAG TPA: hypothetical protein PKV16_07605 [Caldisericia bacterium]|nr:hypothetical protein [Caldisericia bacterium]HPF49464.1 hypothetical protein [Caldisericia bacterium]HPI84682.1 hypothetical protein [Caldisericia bacterium]HPQ93633.1 hypothetical protein [Caldisericia bacterium]HRV75604.1 hypothetical protein [Caldisericia bacterium]
MGNLPNESVKTLPGRGVFIWKLWDLPTFEGDGAVEFSLSPENGEETPYSSLSLDSLVERVDSMGFDWVAIKLGDGDSFWLREGAAIPTWLSSQGVSFEDLIERFHERSIKVLGWHYIYGHPNWETGNSESWCAGEIIKSGVDGYIADGEIELEMMIHPNLYVRSFFTDIEPAAAESDILVAYTTLSECWRHIRFPYSEFARHCDIFMPQTYWVDRNTDCDTFLDPTTEVETFIRYLEVHRKFGQKFTKADFLSDGVDLDHIVPIGSVESELCETENGRGIQATPEELQEFEELCERYFGGEGVWAMDWIME